MLGTSDTWSQQASVLYWRLSDFKSVLLLQFELRFLNSLGWQWFWKYVIYYSGSRHWRYANPLWLSLSSHQHRTFVCLFWSRAQVRTCACGKPFPKIVPMHTVVLWLICRHRNIQNSTNMKVILTKNLTFINIIYHTVCKNVWIFGKFPPKKPFFST